MQVATHLKHNQGTPVPISQKETPAVRSEVKISHMAPEEIDDYLRKQYGFVATRGKKPIPTAHQQRRPKEKVHETFTPTPMDLEQIFTDEQRTTIQEKHPVLRLELPLVKVHPSTFGLAIHGVYQFFENPNDADPDLVIVEWLQLSQAVIGWLLERMDTKHLKELVSHYSTEHQEWLRENKYTGNRGDV